MCVQSVSGDCFQVKSTGFGVSDLISILAFAMHVTFSMTFLKKLTRILHRRPQFCPMDPMMGILWSSLLEN